MQELDSRYERYMDYIRPHRLRLTFDISPGKILFPGDKVVVSMSVDGVDESAEQEKLHQCFVRTDLFLGPMIKAEIQRAFLAGEQESRELWRDYPMVCTSSGNGQSNWQFEFTVTDAGFFWAKPYFIGADNKIHWPSGDNLMIHVHRTAWKSGNSIYCAWPRLMDDGKSAMTRLSDDKELAFKELEESGVWVQPSSGTMRELKSELDFIIDDLGCRIVQLMPVNPVPMAREKLGRMGSPYAAKSLVDIDPSIVEFDKRSTGVEQFCELAKAIHLKEGKLFIDLVINHTGWGSELFEDHPEFFERKPDGEFVSPGAWGNVWADLVALNHAQREQVVMIAQAFLVWCRRGVDGFRCDAGYQVPLRVWRFITARVLSEFPDTIFFLEGLGGAVEATTALLEEGGMQWAYSELFQNESSHDLAHYPEFSERMSRHVGCFVHFSETHDNNRLASRGRKWSIFRNKLCAALSRHGAFGFNTGVEWLASEKIQVHNKSGLNWGGSENIVPLLSNITRALKYHPGFSPDSVLLRKSHPGSSVIVWKRRCPDSAHDIWVLINNDFEKAHSVTLNEVTEGEALRMADVFDGKCPDINKSNNPDSGHVSLKLAPGSVSVLSQTAVEVQDGAGESGFAPASDLVWDILRYHTGEEPVVISDASALEALASEDLEGFIEGLSAFSDDDWHGGDLENRLREIIQSTPYRRVVTWNESDASRSFVLPSDHWLIVRHDVSFRLDIYPADETAEEFQSEGWYISKPCTGRGHVVVIPPDAHCEALKNIQLKLYPDDREEREFITGNILTVNAEPMGIPELSGSSLPGEAPESSCVLLTNRRGGMGIIRLDLGSVDSKYDCVLGANLSEFLPVDRHVFVKRIRLWGRCGNRITPLDRHNLKSFSKSDSATWVFGISDGDRLLTELEVNIWMKPFENSVEVRVSTRNHPSGGDPVSVMARIDIEDRNFHSQTHLDSAYAEFFSRHITDFDGFASGFEFRAAPDRLLTVGSPNGTYVIEEELCRGIPHKVEQSRGQEGAGDAFSPGYFEKDLSTESPLQILISSENDPFSRGLRDASTSSDSQDLHDGFEPTLFRALKQFVVKRESGWTVIAGYPWFLDWGRDTLIVARGMVEAEMEDELVGILRNFGRYEIQGTLPNTIHGGDLSNRHTSDAPLWYGIVCEDMEAKGYSDVYEIEVEPNGRTIREVLTSIADGYRAGTPAGMAMDKQSGLIWSPSHYTWMDTNFPAGTPREGYPIEIQIMWHRLIRLMVRFYADSSAGKKWSELQTKVGESIEKFFWREDLGYLADLLACTKGTPASSAEQDSALRSNQVLAVSLGFIKGKKAQRIVDSVRNHLVIPGGLRSLAPLPVERPLPVHSNDGYLLNDPENPYWPHYEGDEDTRRKPAYHNGTGWSWTFPGFCEALAMAYNYDAKSVNAARSYLLSSQETLWSGCFGQIPENLDGDWPHTQRGCQAQAWGVSETLRVWKILNR